MDMLHKKVKLQNGIEGIIRGFWQNSKKAQLLFMIEIWSDKGKTSDWYSGDEFEIIEE